LERLAAMNMFVRVVEVGSFSAVAKELNSTQPTVSKNIAELESWLGVRLLNRSTRNLRLTETGATYYERCVAILHDVEEAEQSVGLLQTQPKGLIRVSAPAAFGRLHIVPRLEGFFEQYPSIKLDIILSDRVGDLIEDGVSVAFRMGSLRDSNLIARKLCASPTMVVAAQSYLKKHTVPKHPRDLKQHNYLISTDLGNKDHVTFHESGKPLHLKVDGNLQANNSDVLRSALISGLGIAQVPRWLVSDYLRDGELVEVLQEFQLAPINIHAVFSSGRHIPLKLRCFIDYFTDQFKKCAAISAV